MQKPTQLIILGGGSSVVEGINKGLFNKLKGKFVIGINHSYDFYPHHTFMTCLDNHFFTHNNKTKKNIMEDLKNQPLIITKKHPPKNTLPNMLIIKTCSNFDRTLINGAYKGNLTGIYTLSLAIHLLDEGEIFLLGYDFTGTNVPEKKTKGKATTHWYQGQLEHKGIGKVNYYHTKNRAEADFKPFLKETKVKIYNVSMISKLPQFEKITYDEFFKKLNNNVYDQEQLRQQIKNQLKKEK